MKYKGREIKAAMAANSITLKVLTEYVNHEADLDLKADYIGKIVRGVRSNKQVENIIEELFSSWIEGQRELENRVGGIMIPEEIINESV